MQGFVRRNVVPVTGALTLASLALVFGAVLGAIPASALPRVEPLVAVVPHVNAALSLLALGTISLGWRWARRRRFRRHRAAMLASAALFALFLGLYLYRIVHVGPTHFPGPRPLYRFVYLPVLAVHVTLAVVCVPLVYYALLLGLTHDVSELPGTRHATVGRVAAALWLVSFALGVVVYLFLYVAY